MTTSTPATGPAAAAPRDAATHDEQPVRWLTEDQQRDWRAFRDGTALLLDALGRELDEQSGLSLGEYELLVRLSEAPGRTLRMSDLAGDLAHSRSRLTHTVARMERAGLVRRERATCDARGVNCVMTEQGWSTLVAAAPGHVRSVRAHLVDALDADQLAALGSAMQTVVAHLRSPACDAARAAGDDAAEAAGGSAA